MRRVACLLARVARGRRQRARSPPRNVPTFTKDVAPIVFNNCATCHRAGEVAPMALTSYEDVRPWAKVIKNKVVAREMPPWGADPAHSLKMRNDRSLTQAQIDTIVAWVDGGAPKGNDADLPPMPKFAEGWTFGREPDYDPRDAGRVHDSRGRRARRADVLLEGAVERGSVRRDARDSSGQPRGRAPRRRVRRRHSGGREDRQRPPRDAGRQGVDRSRRRRSPDAPTTPRCRARTSCCRGCRAAASIRTAPTSASGFPPASTSTGRSTTTRSASRERPIARASASGSTRRR